MIQKYKNKCKEKGVSPVIGVILLVAVTVALVALSTVIVFNIGSDVGDSADITVQVDETSDGVDVSVLRNENVDELRVISPDSSTESFDSSVGSTAQIQGESGSYNIVAVLEDGSEETVRTVTISEDNAVETESGVVSFNPPVEGALVESYDENDNLVDSDSTGSDGVYVVQEADELRVMGSTVSENAMDTDGNIDLNVVADEESTTVQEILLNGDGTDENPYEINFASDLQLMNEELDSHYVLNTDIDASGTSEWNLKESHEQQEPLVSDGDTVNLDFVADTDTISVLDFDDGNDVGFDVVDDTVIEITDTDADNTDVTVSYDLDNPFNQGFDPIVDFENRILFTGSLDGQGYEIEGLYIDKPASRNIGLIGYNDDGTVENIGVVNADVTGEISSGGLVGTNSEGTINKSYATGDVTGEINSGGLVGSNFEGTINKSYATGSVTGEINSGGLVGTNGEGTINKSYATGDVTGEEDVGGLVGINPEGTVIESYWDTESSGLEDSDGGTGLETEEMTGEDAENNMDGFDFTDTWSITDEYPILE